VILSTIGGLQVLAEPLLFGGASPTGGSDRPVPDAVAVPLRGRFSRFDFGYASTAAWAMFGVIVTRPPSSTTFFVTRLRRS
jgi:cellobiose transport system permease protein